MSKILKGPPLQTARISDPFLIMKMFKKNVNCMCHLFAYQLSVYPYRIW